MKLSFRLGGASLLSVKILTLLFFMVLGTSVALAGGLPPDAEKEAPMMEEDAEVGETAPEAEEETVEAVKDVPEARGDSDRGFSIGVRGGLSLVSSADISAPSASSYGPLDVTADFTEGYSINFALGYAFGNGLRVEAEGGYLETCFKEMDVKKPGMLESLDDTLAGETNIAGKLSAVTLMLNAYYDVDLDSGLAPYLGGGLGMARLSSGWKLGEGAKSGTALVDDAEDDYVLAYQLGAGLGYKISGNGPDITVSLDYRYLASFEDSKFKGAALSGDVESEFGGHYIGGGIRLGL